MLILTTYIPFYFVTIFAGFFVFYAVIFAKDLPALWGRYADFIKKNRLFVLLCVTLVALSVLPGYVMYKNGGSSEVALPARHTDPSSNNIFMVGERKIQGGDMASQLYFDRLFSNHDNMELGVVYVPVFAFVVGLLGMATRVNRLTTLLAVWAFVIFMIALTTSTSLYEFLSSHVFYFKTIRQSYFFFWIMVLPVSVLLLSVQLRDILRYRPAGRKESVIAGIYIVLVHAALAIFLISQQAGAVSYATIVASGLVLGYLYFLKTRSRSEPPIVAQLLPWLVLILIACQSAWVYHHLGRHGQRIAYPKKDNRSDLSFKYQWQGPLEMLGTSQDVAIQQRAIYYCARWYCPMFERMDHRVFLPYVNNVFVLYDQVRFYENDDIIWEELERSLGRHDNVAYVSGDPSTLSLDFDHDSGGRPLVPTAASQDFAVLDYNANAIKFRTGFLQDKFLVYNDAFHSGWRARVNGIEVPIYRSNIAFKGIGLPAGENTVEFQFLSPRHYAVEYFYIVLFFGVFVGVIGLWARTQWPRGHLR
jgi:hypothetical protein